MKTRKTGKTKAPARKRATPADKKELALGAAVRSAMDGAMLCTVRNVGGAGAVGITFPRRLRAALSLRPGDTIMLGGTVLKTKNEVPFIVGFGTGQIRLDME